MNTANAFANNTPHMNGNHKPAPVVVVNHNNNAHHHHINSRDHRDLRMPVTNCICKHCKKLRHAMEVERRRHEMEMRKHAHNTHVVVSHRR